MFVPLHQYTKQRILIRDFEFDYVFDFFRYGKMVHTMFWEVEYESISMPFKSPINDNFNMRLIK